MRRVTRDLLGKVPATSGLRAGLTARPAVVLVGLMTSFLLCLPASAQSGFLEPMGPIAADQRDHFWGVIWLTMIAIIPVFVLTPLILWRYRRRGGKGAYRANWDASTGLDTLMWGVPAAIIIALSVWLWSATHRLDPYQPLPGDAVEVQVVGLDWKWLFIYPDLGIASVGELGMPIETPVSMTLTSDTVMQSFLIGSLAGQIYTMAGMTTQLNLLASQTGTMEGENTQFNGRGFAEQKFDVLAMSESDFESWVETVRQNGRPLDTETYAQLAAPSTKAEAFETLGTSGMPQDKLYFTLPDDTLFMSIVHRYHGGGAVPASAQPGTPAYDPGALSQ